MDILLPHAPLEFAIEMKFESLCSFLYPSLTSIDYQQDQLEEHKLQSSSRDPEYYYMEDLQIYEELPELFSQSFVIIWFSSIENLLYPIMRQLLLEKELDLEKRQAKNKKYSKHKKLHLYIPEFHTLTNGALNQRDDLWEEISFIRVIRNELAHQDEFIPEHVKEKFFSVPFSDNAFQDFIDYLNIHCLLASNQMGDPALKPTPSFCIHLMTFYCHWFPEIFKRLFKRNMQVPLSSHCFYQRLIALNIKLESQLNKT
ncbi:hypothetical protein [Thermoactinomyces sp. DSM 45892]|uniref:hypothetical protein n=1 Tax=Thermoactinomyces sp. DSM 45892 TaxID=1882753 RepID=UPI00089549F0|nr:hypothetical protein [Thermoactinomyces sp. DSM 45892]SDX96385.1 hypothetical protein SAMN05444416_101116 [Thermoactinomyces sp. DSM 45892]